MTIEQLQAELAAHDLSAIGVLDMKFYKILNVSKMIDSHLALLKANPGNARYLPFYNRLRDVALILQA